MKNKNIFNPMKELGKIFIKTIKVLNRKIDIYEVNEIETVIPKENEGYVWLKGYEPDFYYKVKHFSKEYGEVEGIGDDFRAISEKKITNVVKKINIESAINSFALSMEWAIEEDNYYNDVEEHF
jgi:hypothetical protein